MATYPNILAWGKSHGQRSLAGYNPWGGKESDMTKGPGISMHSVTEK